ncbi:MAG: pseudouridine synthase [Methylophilales bacterium]|jgi:23S rRNA pseudouridine2605 synthase|nr:pseudouridine synthase [Pseudomonadota bacterium]NQW34195.1 pseudouridine synthase [Methylophilales bacterium]|tara:strand:+ start:23569 stop:24429 length:861 start_codon:yes stop_codon:yes gene_type:complete
MNTPEKNKSPRAHLNNDSEGIRIHKVLAQSGYGSRREIEKAITEERVKINNVIATLGQPVLSTDKIMFNGKIVHLREENILPRILIYHKPEGELVTENDPEGRPTVFEKLPRIKRSKWISIGRLDFNTSGLLIFTSYGELANRLMHPKYEIEREYSVRVLGELSEDVMSSLKEGIELDDGIAKFETLYFEGGEGANRWYRVTLKEGRNREVRRMFEAFGITVSRLIRVRFGEITLPSHLKRGMFLELKQNEVISLLKWSGLETASFIKPQSDKHNEKREKKFQRKY